MDLNPCSSTMLKPKAPWASSKSSISKLFEPCLKLEFINQKSFYINFNHLQSLSSLMRIAILCLGGYLLLLQLYLRIFLQHLNLLVLWLYQPLLQSPLNCLFISRVPLKFFYNFLSENCSLTSSRCYLCNYIFLYMLWYFLFYYTFFTCTFTCYKFTVYL